MSELSRFFGEREQATMPTTKRTNWPKTEEYLRPVLDTFQDMAGFEPKGFVRQQWIAGARDWVSVFGEDTNLLRLAVEEMRQRKLTVITPRSCISVASELKRNQPDPDRFRKLAKWLDDRREAAEEEDED